MGAASGCTARGVDHSGEMLSLARERNARAIADGRIELREADAQRLPFADGEFAAAATTNAFFFFADPGAMLAEARRTLAPDGIAGVHPLLEQGSRRVLALVGDHERDDQT